MKYLYRVYNYKKITKNMKAKQNIDLDEVSSLFVQLHRFIQCWKIDSKEISDIAKLIKEYIQYLIVWDTSRQSRQDHMWIGERVNKLAQY